MIRMERFPSLDGQRTYQWAPILFRPIHHSPEQLIIGVVLIDGANAHLVRANQLEKIKCLFGSGADEVIFSVTLALDSIENSVKAAGAKAALEFSPPVSGLAMGAFREAQGQTWHAVAERWFAASSAMFASKRHLEMASEVMMPATSPAGSTVSESDKLPRLVMDYVLDRRPNFNRYFSPRIVGDQPVKRRSYEASVDYAGPRLVASFGTLFASRIASIRTIKQRMWDLKVDREREPSVVFSREHEMLVQYPSEKDPQVTPRQYENIVSALGTLEREADINEIRFRPMHTVEDIGAHILRMEQAA